MQVGDKVFVVNWNKIYSTMWTWENGEHKSVFNWETKLPDYCDIDFHWKYEYEPNLTLKGTVNKREPKKLKSKTPIYKEYKYEIIEIKQHPSYPDTTICLIASTHTDQEWNRCYVQIGIEGLSYLTPEQFADKEFNALKEFHKGRYSVSGPYPFKELPEQFLKKIYDADDNVLFGSHYIKGKVYYAYIDGFFMKDGVPHILQAGIEYDGKGNTDLPEGAILMAYSDLPKMFPNNTFR